MFYTNERIGLIIDGVSLHGVSKSLGFDIDFKKLRETFSRKGILTQARYYTTVRDGEDFYPIQPLIDWLNFNGFIVTSKLARSFNDGDGRRKIKGTMNVEMAVDAVAMASYVDHIVMFTGDGEIRPAIEAVQRTGTRVTVCSSIKTSPPMVSEDLRRQADDFLDVQDIKGEFARPKDKS